jgi:hypothetical protein
MHSRGSDVGNLSMRISSYFSVVANSTYRLSTGSTARNLCPIYLDVGMFLVTAHLMLIGYKVDTVVVATLPARI